MNATPTFQEARPTGVPADPDRPTILIVDDETGIARMLQVLLEVRGFAALVSHSGPEALARLDADPVDLILLDVMMPGMDGYEVCRRLKANPAWRSIPVVMLTAKDAVRDVVQGLEIGAQEYIRKPFNTDELVARIRALLREQATSRALAGRHLELQALHAETARRAKQFEALYEVGRTMAATLNLQEILDRVGAAVSSLLAVRAISLMFLTPDGHGLSTAAASAGFDDGLKQSETQAGEQIPSLAAVQDKRVVVVPDLAKEQTYGPWLAAALREGYRAFLAVPLLVQERPVGCLNLYLGERKELGQEELALLTTLASQAAIAIENARLFEETRQLSITDPLTGLANHRQFYDQLAREFRRSQRYRRPLTLLMLDLDRFKHFNDTYGHLAGDEALRETAEVLRQNARAVDILARYGGEEFAIILPETEASRALIQAERVRVAVAEHRLDSLEGEAAKGITVSVGLAALSPAMKRIEDLVQAADEALYRAKSSGRNRIVVAGSDDPAR